MSLKENIESFQVNINHNDTGLACNLGILKIGSIIPDTHKCLKILQNNFMNNNPNIYLKNKKGEETHWTPLMMCVFSEYYDGVNFLLEQGANPNMVGKDGKSPLAISAIKNKTSIIKRLLKSDAEINYTDKQGKTALMNACEAGNFDNVKILLENKADIKIKNNKNQTCIDIGIESKKYDVIKYLEHFYFNSVLKVKNNTEKAKTKI